MVLPQSVLRSFNPKVFDLCESYRVTESQMPVEYSFPNGRWKHGDWFAFKDTTRLSTARRPQLPFRMDEGVKEQVWMIWDVNYPASPNLRIENKDVVFKGRTLSLPHALVDCAKEDSGWASFSAYLNGEWVPCFKSYRKIIGGRRLAFYTGGLKQDLTVAINDDGSLRSDVMGWIDPPTCSWNKI